MCRTRVNRRQRGRELTIHLGIPTRRGPKNATIRARPPDAAGAQNEEQPSNRKEET